MLMNDLACPPQAETEGTCTTRESERGRERERGERARDSQSAREREGGGGAEGREDTAIGTERGSWGERDSEPASERERDTHIEKRREFHSVACPRQAETASTLHAVSCADRSRAASEEGMRENVFKTFA